MARSQKPPRPPEREISEADAWGLSTLIEGDPEVEFAALRELVMVLTTVLGEVAPDLRGVMVQRLERRLTHRRARVKDGALDPDWAEATQRALDLARSATAEAPPGRR